MVLRSVHALGDTVDSYDVALVCLVVLWQSGWRVLLLEEQRFCSLRLVS